MHLFSLAFAAGRRAASVGLVLAGGAFASVPSQALSANDGAGRIGVYLGLASATNARGASLETFSGGRCAWSNAEPGLRAARDEDGRVNALAMLILMQEHPRAVRAWASSGGALTSARITTLSSPQAITLGVPDCVAA